MTSLELFKKVDVQSSVPPDWGTGRYGTDDLWISRAPTWQTTGLPLDHHYTLTALKLSNVRDNDELVPRPQGNDISKKFINQPFPGEHPYSSHMEKFAFIPKFDSPQDPKRGVAARQVRPINDEMPANAYNITVVKKIKGFPYREEIQALPTEGKKEPLYWQGEHYFDQQSKLHGNRQQFYPIPPKQTAPNLQDRPAELRVSDRSANVLRNIERNQWIPTQKLDYTGLGPANPMALDNADCKRAVYYQTGEWDDKLYPRSVNTFDPARPMEGRLRKLFAPKPPQQIMIESGTSANPNHQRKMTLTEREEDRLLNGKDYVNLPEDPNDPLKDKRWQELDRSTRPEPNLERLQSVQGAGQGDQEEFQVPERDEQKVEDYLGKQKQEMHRAVQGMEARNRWRLLESGTPDHDIAQLKEKYKMLNDKEQPSSFYRHEGRYNEERAGLYKTSYDPDRLTYSMNAQQLSGGTLFNTSGSHIEASLYPTVTWDENEAALKGSKTVVFKNSELSGDRPSTADMLNPYRETVAIQRATLQPNVATSRPRVQEGEYVLREDTMGDSYNTRKFLQENKLDRNIRIEPTDVMSHGNQNLERTRERVALRQPGKKSQLKNKSVHFSDNVHVQNVHENMPVKIGDSHTKSLSNIEEEELCCAFGQNKVNSLGYTETHPQQNQMKPTACSGEFIVGDTRNLAENLLRPTQVPTVVARNTEPIVRPAHVSFSRDTQLKPAPISETTDEFRSLSTNFMPSGLTNESSMRSSYSTQFPVYDLSEKKDLRFSWEPGTGQLRPQSCLLDLQNSFIKSEVRNKFHRTYPEINPEIRMNINTDGKENKQANPGCSDKPNNENKEAAKSEDIETSS